MTKHDILKKYFGFDSFRPGQEEIIDSILANKDVLAVLPTGAGKSLCYQIPALMGSNYSIVISPLIALMKDQVDALNKNQELSAYINSSLDFSETQKVLNKLNNNKIKLLYVAPERLTNPSFIDTISQKLPDYLFIDEAHCISEWGHNFRPSYRKIIEFIDHLEIKNIAAFTATATPTVRKDIIAQLRFNKADVIVKGFERVNLALKIVKTRQKKEKTLSYLKKYSTPAIIYTGTRKLAEETSYFLRMNGLRSAHYHAGLASGLRTIIQDDFLNDRTEVICATNAFGMGIDKKDIRTIIHTNIPGSLENYYQEIGRAGRDGMESNILLFYEGKDKSLQEFLINNSYPSREHIAVVYNSLYDYGQVALGSIRDDLIELDDNYFKITKAKDLSEPLIVAAIRILENSGYIESASDLKQNYYFKFSISSIQLQSYVKQLGNSALKEIIISLLRLYGSDSFIRQVKLDLTDITNSTGEERNKIKDQLLTLSSIGIIEYQLPTSNSKIKLKQTRIETRYIKLNEDYDTYRKNALLKLDEMIKFVETQKCRFRFILEYFGEIESDYTCGKCDKCIGRTEDTSEIMDYLEEIILNTLHEARTRIRTNDLVNILRGHSPSGKFKNYSSFGTCEHFSKDQLKASIDSLVNSRLITQFDGHLVLSDDGKSNFIKMTTPESHDISDSADNDGTMDLFHQLKAVRKEASKKFSQAEEMICSDEIMKKIAELKPESHSKLIEVEGITNRLINKIGDDIISTVKEFQRNRKSTQISSNSIPENLSSVLKLLEKGYNLDEISSLMKLSDHLISIQIDTLIHLDPKLNIDKLMTKGEKELIYSKIKEGFTEMKELKEELPNEISYSKIRIVLAKSKISQSRSLL
ncbi:MAG: RecQ family ATP-dependent DNA helicase [Bacteroidetes bacterium]|nr:RecQ family ATP-dependent DNA helicase [Bacteroidota bacterium]